jgi:hypothetical protein
MKNLIQRAQFVVRSIKAMKNEVKGRGFLLSTNTIFISYQQIHDKQVVITQQFVTQFIYSIVAEQRCVYTTAICRTDFGFCCILNERISSSRM